jgi:large subunit ribosomal protein L21
MYVIVDIAGQQYKVEKDQKLFVNRLEGEAGSKVDFDRVLLVDDDGKVQVGMPLIKNMLVSASIVSHVKGDTVKVFKKKRRKGYQKLNGHRQSFTEILIESIGEGQPKEKAAAKKESASKPVSEAAPAEAVAEIKPKTVAKPKTKADTAEVKSSVKAKPAKAAAQKKETTAKAKSPAKKATTAKAAPKAKKESKKDSKE